MCGIFFPISKVWTVNKQSAIYSTTNTGVLYTYIFIHTSKMQTFLIDPVVKYNRHSHCRHHFHNFHPLNQHCSGFCPLMTPPAKSPKTPPDQPWPLQISHGPSRSAMTPPDQPWPLQQITHDPSSRSSVLSPLDGLEVNSLLHHLPQWAEESKRNQSISGWGE